MKLNWYGLTEEEAKIKREFLSEFFEKFINLGPKEQYIFLQLQHPNERYFILDHLPLEQKIWFLQKCYEEGSELYEKDPVIRKEIEKLNKELFLIAINFKREGR